MRGIIVIGLLMGCNNGGEDPQKVFLKSIFNLGKGFLDIFTSFGEMVTDSFSIKADTKKSQIGDYFNKIADTMKIVKERLNTVVAENGNYAKVKTVVDEFVAVLDQIAAGAKEAAGGAKGDAIGNAKQGEDAMPGEVASVNTLVKGIKAIVEVVLKDKGSADANGTEENDKKDIGKLFSKASDNGAEAEAAKANASIGAVSGADILKAISSSGIAQSNKDIDQATNAAEIATAKNSGSTKETKKKDAVIAGGIALRAMAKDGKFATKSSETKSAHAINGVASSAVNKALSTLVIAIRTTVDNGLKKVNEALAAVNQGDMLPETSESGAAKK